MQYGKEGGKRETVLEMPASPEQGQRKIRFFEGKRGEKRKSRLKTRLSIRGGGGLLFPNCCCRERRRKKKKRGINAAIGGRGRGGRGEVLIDYRGDPRNKEGSRESVSRKEKGEGYGLDALGRRSLAKK